MNRQVYRAVDSYRMILLVLMGAVILMTFPILNGGPFFYFDTAAYIEQTLKAVRILSPALSDTDAASSIAAPAGQTFGNPQEDKIVFGGRSIYYGVFAYLGWVTHIWVPVIVQSLVVSWLVIMLFRHASVRGWAYKALVTLMLLALLSSASLFVGLIMPDIWAGALILALALLWAYNPQLSTGTKWALFGILSFAVLAHNSHLALLMAMTTCLVLVQIIPSLRAHATLGLVAIPLLAIGIGIAGQVAYATAVRVVYQAEVLQRPFITAHLADLGPGTRLAKQTCPQSGFALCAFTDRLPVDWIDFLFDTDPDAGIFAAAPVSVQKALAEEQMAFALQTLKAEPGVMVAGLVADGVSQLWTLSMDDVALSHANAGYIRRNLPPDLINRLEGTRIYAAPELADLLLRSVQLSSAASGIVLAVWAIRRREWNRSGKARGQGMDRMIFILVAGLVLNALICGILASPYGRFQARVIWILPLVAALILTNWPPMPFARKPTAARLR